MWSWTMGIPRFLLLWPILSLLLVQTFGANFGNHATVAIVVQTLSVLGLAALAATTWIGLRFWRQRSTVVMLLLLLVFSGFTITYFIGLFVSTRSAPSLL
jgi:hypothetical protein